MKKSILFIGCLIGSSAFLEAMEQDPSNPRKRPASAEFSNNSELKRRRLEEDLQDQVEYIIDLQANLERGNENAPMLLPEAIERLQDLNQRSLEFQWMVPRFQEHEWKEIGYLASLIETNPEKVRKLMEALTNDIKELIKQSASRNPEALVRLQRAQDFFSRLAFAIKYSAIARK